ncbi:MAG: AsmA-like C-terminal domain-containing protein [Ignavibacteria bacterium]|nr:AsmA-like C-terminal domain-containing protein [Ignavibacteria bacterium]
MKNESIRREIISTVFEETQSSINFESIEIFLLPTPHIKVYKGNFNYEAHLKAICDFDSITIYPTIIPLFKGNFKLKQISINNPKLSIKLPQQSIKTVIPENSEASFLYYFEKYYEDLIIVASKWPGIKVQINNGDLELFDNDKQVLRLEDFKTNYKFNKNLINVIFSGKSGFANFIRLKAKISSLDNEASIDLHFDGLDPQNFSSLIFKNSTYAIEKSKVNLAANIKIDGSRKISGNISSSNFSLNLFIKDKLININGTDLNGNFHIDDDKELFSITKVNLNSPRMKISGEFLIDKQNENNTIKIQGYDVDIETTREISLSVFGHYDVIKKIFQLLQGGEFESIDFLAESKNFNEIFKDENFQLKGNIKNGDIFVPKYDLSFKNVKGNASIINGVLYGKNLFGKMGSSILRNGTLNLGLGKDNDIFKIEIDIDGNLPELQPYLYKFIRNEEFLKFLSSLDNIDGIANGKLILGDKKSDLKAKVKIDNFNLSLNYPKIPDEIHLTGSDLLYEKDYIYFKNVKGNISNTTFRNLTGKYQWGDKSTLEISSLDSNVSMEELYPWVSSFDMYIKYLNNFDKTRGGMNITDFNFRGPISNSKKWNLNFKGEGEIYNQDKLNYSFIVIKTPAKFKLNNLKIKDEESEATFNLESNDESYLIDYSGKLSKKTTEKFLRENRLKLGWIEGNMSINYIKNDITKSSAKGTIKGGQILYPLKSDNTIKIDNFSLNAQNDKININSLNLVLEDHEMNISGNVYIETDKIKIDLDASANEIEWTELTRYFEDPETNKLQDKNKESINMPIEGTIKVDVSNFNYGKLLWSPLQADINFSEGKVNVEVNKAIICNISTTGYFGINNNNLKMNFDAFSENNKIEETLKCFLDDKELIKGIYDLQADINSYGDIDKIREKLNGGFTFILKDGKISSKNPFSLAILKAINITEIYRGKLPDFSSEGLEFSKIYIEGDVERGVIKFKDATLESPYVGILFSGYINLIDETYDLKFRVAVFKSVQGVIKKIPLVKRLNTEKIISIPVRVKGDFNKPDSNQTYKE